MSYLICHFYRKIRFLIKCYVQLVIFTCKTSLESNLKSIYFLSCHDIPLPLDHCGNQHLFKSQMVRTSRSRMRPYQVLCPQKALMTFRMCWIIWTARVIKCIANIILWSPQNIYLYKYYFWKHASLSVNIYHLCFVFLHIEIQY